MFFNKIEDYSNKKLSLIYWMSLLGYFAFMLVGPLILVAVRYEMFKEAGTKSLTGFGICILVAFLVIGLKALKSKFEKLPENTVAQRRVKFSIQLIYSLMFPVACVFILGALNSNFELAFSTIRDSLIFIFLGIFLDNLVVKYVEAERSLRFETQRDKEKAKRMNLFK